MEFLPQANEHYSDNAKLVNLIFLTISSHFKKIKYLIDNEIIVMYKEANRTPKYMLSFEGLRKAKIIEVIDIL